MGLRIETWTIAYRKRAEDLLLGDTSGFKEIKNGHKGWYADPFLFDYNDKTYLFAEFFSYKLNRGVLVCSEYNERTGKFSDFKTIISEPFHLSYPFVFELNNKVYLMPESNEANALYLYEAIDFPYKWKKAKVILNDIKLVDSTLFKNVDDYYVITMRIDNNEVLNNQMLLYKVNTIDFSFSECCVISDDISISRPGGRVLNIGDDTFFVTQDCNGEYGKALNFLRVAIESLEIVKMELVKKIIPDSVEVDCKKKYSGIHTYNTSKEFEVIDLKCYENSYVRLIYKFLSKLGLH